MGRKKEGGNGEMVGMGRWRDGTEDGVMYTFKFFGTHPIATSHRPMEIKKTAPPSTNRHCIYFIL